MIVWPAMLIFWKTERLKRVSVPSVANTDLMARTWDNQWLAERGTAHLVISILTMIKLLKRKIYDLTDKLAWYHWLKPNLRNKSQNVDLCTILQGWSGKVGSTGWRIQICQISATLLLSNNSLWMSRSLLPGKFGQNMVKVSNKRRHLEQTKKQQQNHIWSSVDLLVLRMWVWHKM